jgi:hypothetical protein
MVPAPESSLFLIDGGPTVSRRPNPARGARKAGVIAAGIVLLLGVSSPVRALQSTPPPEPRPPQLGPFLEMTEFPDDPNAAAVILIDRGVVTFDDEGGIEIERTRRIKILRESAFDRATVHITFRGSRKNISGISGRTYPPGRGTAESVDLDPDDIFEESTGRDTKRLVFTLPGLKPGCIIEYRYRIRHESLYALGEWDFQYGDPVLWCELVADIPDRYHYTIVHRNITSFTIDSSEPHSDVTGRTPPFTRRRWVLTDVPGLYPEPFVWTLEDHRKTLFLQLRAVVVPGRPAPVEVLTTWQALGDELRGSRDFGGQMSPPPAWKKRAKAIREASDDPIETMRAVYDDVRRRLVWNGRRSVFPAKPLTEALGAKHVGSAEFGLLLTGMLREAGLRADPVVVSTRDRGKLFTRRPLLTQFNHVVTAVEIEDRTYLLDATDPYRPWFLLPQTVQGCEGLIIPRDASVECSFVRVKPGPPEASHVALSAALQPDGMLVGSVEFRAVGHSAVRLRRELQETGDAAAALRKRWFQEVDGATVDSVTVADRDSIEAPLVLRASVRIPGAAGAGSPLYVPAMPVERLEKNPLEAVERRYPIEIGNQSMSSYSMTLEVPEGYRVTDVPGELSVNLPDGAGQLLRTAFLSNGRLEYRLEHSLRRTEFPRTEYASLRDFMGALAVAGAERIVVEVDPAAGAE